MASKLKHMQMMHTICQREMDELNQNLRRFAADSTKMQQLIYSRVEQDLDKVFSLVAFDKYMSQVATVANLTRKVNIHVQLNSISQALSCKNKDVVTSFVERTNSTSEFDVDVKSICTEEDRKSSQELDEKGLLATSSGSVRKVRFDNAEEQHASVDTAEPASPFDALSTFTEQCVFRAAVTYIEDLAQPVFYVCQMDNADLLHLSTMSDLESFGGPPPTKEVFGVSINDENILRAVVQPNTKENCVLLIDFGEEVPIGSNCKLFKIPTKYQSVPARAIKCKLLGVRFSDGYEEQDPSQMATVLQRYEFKEANFKVIRKIDRTLHVLLYVQQKKGPNIPINALNPFLNSDEFVDDASASVHQKENAKPQLMGARTELDLNKSPKQRKGTSTIPVQSKGKPRTDGIRIITVTHIVSATSFYAHIEEDVDVDGGGGGGGESRQPLFWRDDELTLNQKLLLTPQCNDLVLAQYVRDQFWYRAQVLEVDDQKQLFKVHYVDYGNTEEVPLSCLAKCTLSQTDEPFRAVLCRLGDVCDLTEANEILREQAVQALLVILINQRFAVKIVKRKGNELLIKITDPEFSNVPNIITELGYVKKALFTPAD